MSERLIDLNAVISPDINVRLGDKSYKLPGDAPVEDLLRLMVKAEELDKTENKAPQEILEEREEIAADVEELFRIRQPNLPEGEISLSDAQLVELLVGLSRIYNEALADAQSAAGGGRPTQTPPKPRRRKPSATSSARRRPRSGSASSTSSPT